MCYLETKSYMYYIQIEVKENRGINATIYHKTIKHNNLILLHRDVFNKISLFTSLQACARNEDEQDDERGRDPEHPPCDGESSFPEQLANKGFLDLDVLEEGVFAQADHCQNRVESVLVRGKCVDTDGERDDDLGISLAMFPLDR